MITEQERDAVIRYLHFNLTAFVDTYKDHVPEDIHQHMAANAQTILHDLFQTMSMDLAMKLQAEVREIKKKLGDDEI